MFQTRGSATCYSDPLLQVVAVSHRTMNARVMHVRTAAAVPSAPTSFEPWIVATWWFQLRLPAGLSSPDAQTTTEPPGSIRPNLVPAPARCRASGRWTCRSSCRRPPSRCTAPCNYSPGTGPSATEHASTSTQIGPERGNLASDERLAVVIGRAVLCAVMVGYLNAASRNKALI